MKDLSSLLGHPVPSSTVYSAAGKNPFFVDDLTPQEGLQNTTSLVQRTTQDPKESEKLKGPKFISLDELSTLVNREEEEAEETEAKALNRLIILLRQVMMTQKSSKFRNNSEIGQQLRRIIWNHQKVADCPKEMPLHASEHGLFSAFRYQDAHIVEATDDARPTDHRLWPEGFDVRVFSQSARLREGNGGPILVKYRLSGNEQKYRDFYDPVSVYGRSREAWKQFMIPVDCAINSNSAPAAAELSRISERFFKGLAMNEAWERENARAVSSGDEDRSGYIIEYHETAWAKFVREAVQCAAQEAYSDEDEVPFKNTSHKNFGIFIQDVILANELEKARIERVTWNSAKVFQSDAQAKARQVLDDGKDFTPRDLEVIATLRAEVDKDMFVEGSIEEIEIHISTDDNNNPSNDTTYLNELEIAEAAAAQLLAEQAAEQAAELSKNVPKKKPRNRKPKSKASKTSVGSREESPASDNLSGLEEVGESSTQSTLSKSSSQNKQDEAGQNSSKGADVKDVKSKTDGPAPLESKSSATGNSKTKSSLPSLKGSVVTLADFEDAPADVLDENKGWQTVAKSKATKPKSNAARAVSGGVQGTNNGSQRGLNQPASVNLQNGTRQPSNPNGVNRATSQSGGFKAVGNKSTTSTQKKTTPAPQSTTAAVILIGSSSKPAMQTPLGQPERYENEFPAMPAQASKPIATKNVLKIAVAIPRELPKSLVITKGKNANPAATFKDGEQADSNFGSGAKSLALEDAVTSDDTTLKNHKGGDSELGPDATSPVSRDVTTKHDASVQNFNGKKSNKNSKKGKQTKVADGPAITPLVGAESIKEDNAGLEKFAEKNFVVENQAEKESKSAEKTSVVEKSVVDKKSVSTTNPSFATDDETKSALVQLAESNIDHDEFSDDPSNLEDDGPATPQYANSVNPVDSDSTNKEHGDMETLENQSKPLDSSLAWVSGPLTGPAGFEGRPRSSSLPQDMYRPEEVFGETPPSLIRRGRGLSLRSCGSEKEKVMGSDRPSTILEENLSPRVAQPSDETTPSDNATPSENATPAKKVIVVTIHGNSGIHVSIPAIDNTSTAHEYTSGTHQAHQNQSGDAQVLSTGISHSHPSSHGNGNQAHGNLSTSVPASNVHNPHAYSLPGGLPPFSNGGGGGHIPGTDWVPQLGDQEETYYCTQCTYKIVPTMKNKLVFCSGCGPDTFIKYCSIACLLVHAYDHAPYCWNYPAYARAYPHSFPPDSPYTYETNPIMSEDQTSGTCERFRQRTFMLYARYGDFPNLAEAWLRKHPEFQWPDLLIYWDSMKYTGVYHIFSSGAFEPTDRGNPKAHVIFVVSFPNGHPQKAILSRMIRALLVRDEGGISKPMAKFVFRLIRNILITPELYNKYGVWEPVELVLPEFERQFKLEFGFDRSMDTDAQVPFNFDREVSSAMPCLIMTEIHFSVLRYWCTDS